MLNRPKTIIFTSMTGTKQIVSTHLRKVKFILFVCCYVLLFNQYGLAQSPTIIRTRKIVDSLAQTLKAKAQAKDEHLKLDSLTVDFANQVCDNFIFYFENPKISLMCFSKLAKIAEKADNKVMLTNVLRKTGTVYMRQFIYDKSTEYYLKAFQVAESAGDTLNMAHSLSNLGNIYARLAELSNPKENYLKGLDYQLRAINLLMPSKEFVKRVGNALLNSSNDYRGLGQHEKAIENLQKAFKIYVYYENQNGIDLTKTNLAETYIDFAKKTGKNEYLLVAEKYLTNDLLTNELSSRQADILNLKGEICLLQNKLDDALFYLTKALKHAQKRQNTPALQGVAVLLTKLYTIKKDYEKSLVYQKLNNALKDSMLSEKSHRQIVMLNSQFENERQEREINFLTKDKEFKEAEIRTQKTVFKILTIGGVLIVIIIILLYGQSQVKQRLNLQLDQTNKNLIHKNYQIEKQREKITDNIAYAELIQNVMLQEQNFGNYFSDFFIYYSPKAVVSGDFYWCAEVGNKIVIAVADCTGHGVPGAFMSILGNMILNQIVVEQKNVQPSQILKLLNIEVKKTLQQDKENALSDDGMDISICSIDFEKKCFAFSGAQLPLYVIENNQLTIVKPDVRTIGGNRFRLKKSKVLEKEFTEYDFSFKTSTSIYLFSDGFMDQFGGVHEKKVGSQQFQELLLGNSKLSMTEQKNNIEVFHKQWKGNLPQTDDILVMGIKL